MDYSNRKKLAHTQHIRKRPYGGYESHRQQNVKRLIGSTVGSTDNSLLASQRSHRRNHTRGFPSEFGGLASQKSTHRGDISNFRSSLVEKVSEEVDEVFQGFNYRMRKDNADRLEKGLDAPDKIAKYREEE